MGHIKKQIEDWEKCPSRNNIKYEEVDHSEKYVSKSYSVTKRIGEKVKERHNLVTLEMLKQYNPSLENQSHNLNVLRYWYDQTLLEGITPKYFLVSSDVMYTIQKSLGMGITKIFDCEILIVYNKTKFIEVR